jgi:regulatory protein
LHFLSYRVRSSQEVRRKLREKKFSDTAIEAVMERLERVGLLDDETFARFWVENRETFKPRGARALRYELRQKGVSDDDIEAVLADLDEEDSAYRAAQQRIRRYQQVDEATFRKRMGAYLSRRGFNYAIIRDVLDRIWDELNNTAGAQLDDDPDFELEE